ncbi:MAG: hypothetical protein IGR80_10640 [Synechococcales cyanobacterium K44_A2020_017]|nr:hypothetical protein [Synechococcales cyanobacterium K32_A2020_035]MBF2095200.1 hypothetical protein [Synechococcales cyanobacterium K44_A2020_017]
MGTYKIADLRDNSKYIFRKLPTVTAIFLFTVTIAAPAIAEPVDPSALPTYVPAGSRAAARHISVQPAGWTSVTPWGEAINTTQAEGYIEMASWEMVCDVNGTQTIMVSGLQDIGAGAYLTNPWYGNDENTVLETQRTEYGLRIPVIPGRVAHWWLNTPRPEVENAQNCEVTAQVRMSPGVFASFGGDWWVDTTSGWNGQDVNNQYMGRSDWHDHVGGWQTIRF